MHDIIKINNLFTIEEQKTFLFFVDKSKIPVDKNNNYIKRDINNIGIDENLGRLQFDWRVEKNKISETILTKLSSIAKKMSTDELKFDRISAVEYSGKYGTPNLPIHYDHDDIDLIVNYQFASNTKWDIGVGTNTYSLEDNSAIIFNPNKYAHWRPHKKFNNEEYVQMIFMRFQNAKNINDYSNLNYLIGHDVFKEIEIIREKSKR